MSTRKGRFGAAARDLAEYLRLTDLDTADAVEEPMSTATSPEIRYAWLAKKNQSGPPDILGLFTSPERAKRVCQESANEYMGGRSTPALIWQGDDTCCSASYDHPAAGMQVFTIDMYELDKGAAMTAASLSQVDVDMSQPLEVQ